MGQSLADLNGNASRSTYYRRVALSVGVPPQFVEDVAQEIETAIALGDPEVSWKVIARRTAIDQLRFWCKSGFDRVLAEPPVSLEELVRLPEQREPDQPVDALDEQDKRRAVQEILGILPVREHLIVQLRMEGWLCKDIGTVLGITESRVAWLEKEGVTMLRRALM